MLRGCASLVLAISGWASFAPTHAFARQAQPPPSGAPSSQVGKETSRPGQPPFHPGLSTWSRYGETEIPAEVEEPTGAELAAQLDLEVLGPQGPDQIVHYRHKKTGMLFVFVPGGAFPMGSNYGEISTHPQIGNSAQRGDVDELLFASEQPQRSIYVSSYFIGVYEVTNAEYGQFLDEFAAGKVSPDCEYPFAPQGEKHLPYLWNNPKFPFFRERQPISGISWLDAWAFARWMGGRLPTEAEWEKAARGTDRRIWPWGNTFDEMRANTEESGNRSTLDVGTFPGGRSVYGCYEMAGNVGEFVIDAFEQNVYRFMPAKDPCLLEHDPWNQVRVVRGGRWNRFGLLHTSRCTARGKTQLKLPYPSGETDKNDYPVIEYLVNGLRVVLSPKVDLFPEGRIEELRKKYDAAEEERRKAIERRKEPQPPPAGDR